MKSRLSSSASYSNSKHSNTSLHGQKILAHLLLSPLLLWMLELRIKEFIVHVNYLAWKKVHNVHKHTWWNFEHVPLFIHSFWRNWERETQSWFPVLEKLSLFGMQSSKDLLGYKTNPKNSIIFSKDNIKIELPFVFGLCFCILQDPLVRSPFHHFFNFIEKVCHSYFCVCIMCFSQWTLSVEVVSFILFRQYK